MLIQKANSPITGLINALILSVPMWAAIGFTLWIISKVA